MSAGDEMWLQGAAASYVKIGLFPECLTLFGLLKQPRSLQMTHLPPGALPAGMAAPPSRICEMLAAAGGVVPALRGSGTVRRSG